MLGNDITDQYLSKMYDDLMKEQNRLMTDLKSGTSDVKQGELTKQISIINSICLNVIKLNNLRKKQQSF